jgi:acyl-CoA thioesterase-1
MALFLKLLLTLMLLGPGLAHAGATLLVYGDSLSAAYGIGQKEGWVTLLEQRLRQKQLDYTVANASISGETSSGGASRIAATLALHKPQIVIVALGSNDGLRGLPVKQMRDNLAAIVAAAQKSGSRVLLVGMKMPPNYGPQYTREFEQVYADLARRYKTAFTPFLLEGVAGRRELFLDDNMHPVARAQPMLLENIWKALAPLLK